MKVILSKNLDCQGMFLSEFTLPSFQAEFLKGPAGGSEFHFVNPFFSL